MTNRFFSPNEQFANSAGIPYSGGSLAFYATGTNTPLNVYSDSALSVVLLNPVTLDSAGRSGSIFLQNLSYKVVLKDALANQIWTEDPVYASDFSTVAQLAVYAGNPNGHVAGTAGSGSTPSSVVWDTADNILYVCTTTGTAITAAWTGQSVTAAGNNSFSGINTFSGAVDVTDGTNQANIAALSTGSIFVASNFTQSGEPRFQIQYSPTAANVWESIVLRGTNARIQILAENTSNTGVNPQIVVADLNVLGVPVLNGGNQAGIGLIGNGVQGTSSLNVNIVNTGGATTGAYNSALINIWGTSSAGDTQNIITFFNGTGTNAWNGTLTATVAGGRLGEICGCGSLPDGHFTQSETWSINGHADAAFTGTTNDGSYTALTNTVFRNAVATLSAEQIVGGFYAPGTWAVGAWAQSGNAFKGGVGTITMANVGSAPSGGQTGAGVLFVAAGALKYMGSSGTITPLAAA